MKIVKRYIPTKFTKIRPGIKMKPLYLTVHNTANKNKGANAEAHARLLESGNDGRQASWHYTVDDKGIIQHLPDNETAWHAGDGRGPGNMSSIGIEICENSDGNYAKAEENTIWLIRKLMDELGIPISRVVPHKHWSGKNCPNRILGRWDSFISQIKSFQSSEWTKEQLEQIAKLNPAPNGAKFSRTLRYVKGNQMVGDDVLAVQLFLGVTPAKDSQGRPYGIYGPKTEEAVLAYRLKMGAKERTGSVGIWTWKQMFGEKEDKPSPKPDPKNVLHRVIVDGKQVGAWENEKNLLNAVGEAVGGGAKKVIVEKV